MGRKSLILSLYFFSIEDNQNICVADRTDVTFMVLK